MLTCNKTLLTALAAFSCTAGFAAEPQDTYPPAGANGKAVYIPELPPSVEINLSPIVVTATRSEERSFDLPVSIDEVSAEHIQDSQLQAHISESLVRVPGIVTQFRGQDAQDVQLSSRGFGARSQFGIRGIRLYADGIPLTMPDGQGQAGSIDLSTTRSIEVMRGPFSALYGNSSGGVVQVFTADGPAEPTAGASITTGSYNTHREMVKFGDTTGIANYIADYSHLTSDGYRQHSYLKNDHFNTKVGIQLRDDTRITLVANYLNEPLAQDPQGLTKANWRMNPTQVVNSSNTFNTRVSRDNRQVGARLEHDFDSDDKLSLMVYDGNRDNTQYQSIGSNAAGTAITTVKFILPTSATSGGVAQINRDFYGTDWRFTHKGQLLGGPYSLSLGVNYDKMSDHRTGYDNFVPVLGTPVGNVTCGSGIICGVKGTLRRDEDDRAWDFDQYAQAEWAPQSQWSLVAGLRHSDVHVDSTDHYLSNGNDGGSVSFAKTTPVAGVVFKVTPLLNLYANAGKGFETPTMVEMAYKPGVGTFNFSLQPATSNNYEVGAKAFIGTSTRATLAVFRTDTSNEIVVANSFNGRATYQNASGTERNGVELSVDTEFLDNFAAYVSYAYLDATYSSPFCSGFVTTSSAVCAAKNAPATPTAWVRQGKPLPGTYRQTGYAEISWKYVPAGFSTALEAHAMDKVYVDDKNYSTAPGSAVVSWRGSLAQNIGHWRTSEFVRVDNLFDRNYVSSVKIADSNSQYFESGANRNWLLGINASYQF